MCHMTLSQVKYWEAILFCFIVTLMLLLSVNKIGVYIYEYDYIPYVVSRRLTVYGTAPLSKIAACL